MSDKKPELKEAPDATNYYSNQAQVSSSFHDFRIRFGQAQDDGTMLVGATVYLSAGHAKSFLKVLEGQVRRFEAKMGEIQIKPINSESAEDNGNKEA